MEKSKVIALTGSRSALGSQFIELAEASPDVTRIVVLDRSEPPVSSEKIVFCKTDLTQPGCDRDIAEALQDHHVDCVVHTAFLSGPIHDIEFAHELEDIGTMHLARACAAAKPAQVIMTSTTLVYGATPSNPNYLNEQARVRGGAACNYIADKVHAENQLNRFAEDNPATAVCRLRFAPIMGPTIDNMFTRYFARPALPAPLGFDPLFQLVHEHDATRALMLAACSKGSVRGPVNIVGRGVLPYRTILAMLGRIPVPMPHAAVRALAGAAWWLQFGSMPASMTDLLRFPCVADGTRAADVLDFHPRFGPKETLTAFQGSSLDGGLMDFTRVHG